MKFLSQPEPQEMSSVFPQLPSLRSQSQALEIQSNQLRVFPSESTCSGVWLPGDICPASNISIHPPSSIQSAGPAKAWLLKCGAQDGKTATHTGPIHSPAFLTQPAAGFLLVSPLQLPGPAAGSTASRRPQMTLWGWHRPHGYGPRLRAPRRDVPACHSTGSCGHHVLVRGREGAGANLGLRGWHLP